MCSRRRGSFSSIFSCSIALLVSWLTLSHAAGDVNVTSNSSGNKTLGPCPGPTSLQVLSEWNGVLQLGWSPPSNDSLAAAASTAGNLTKYRVYQAGVLVLEVDASAAVETALRPCHGLRDFFLSPRSFAAGCVNLTNFLHSG